MKRPFGAAPPGATSPAEPRASSAWHHRRTWRFRAAVGIGPKEFARIRRVRWTAVDLVEHESDGWVDRAARAAFSDQAHLSREYRELFGASPSRVAELLGRISHGRLLPPDRR